MSDHMEEVSLRLGEDIVKLCNICQMSLKQQKFDPCEVDLLILGTVTSVLTSIAAKVFSSPGREEWLEATIKAIKESWEHLE